MWGVGVCYVCGNCKAPLGFCNVLHKFELHEIVDVVRRGVKQMEGIKFKVPRVNSLE
jgi:hypothetical protein